MRQQLTQQNFRSLSIVKVFVKQSISIVFFLLLIQPNKTFGFTYYSKADAINFNDTASWGAASDGMGQRPSAINNNDIYIVANNAKLIVTGNITIRSLEIISGSLDVTSYTLTLLVPSTKRAYLTINGGQLNLGGSGNIVINGGFSMLSGSFNQTGGEMSINGNSGVAASSLLSGVHHFNITGGVPNCIAGTITIVNPPHSSYAAYLTRAISISLSASNNYFSGSHTFILGDGIATLPGNANGFSVETFDKGRAPIQNLIVNGGATTGRCATTSCTLNSMVAGTHIKGVLTINPACEFKMNTASSNTNELSVGSVVNDGIFTTSQGSSAPPLTIGLHPGLGNIQIGPSVISGTGVYRVSTSSPTAAFGSVVFNNPEGVSLSGSILSLGTYGGHVATDFTLTSGEINLNGGTFVLGTGPSANATFTYASGGFYNGGFKRYVAASALVGTTTGLFPFFKDKKNRSVQITTTSNILTAGSITVSQFSTPGHSTVSGSDISGVYAFNRVTNSGWTIATGDGITGGTYSLSMMTESVIALLSISNEPRLITGATTSVGTHAVPGGSVHLAIAGRTGLAVTDLASTFYLGLNASNIAITNLQSGEWSDPAIWSTGLVPTSLEAITIDKGTTVSVSSGTCNAERVFVNGTLNVVGGTLNIAAPVAQTGASIGNTGILNINGGTMVVGTGNTRYSTLSTALVSTSQLNVISGLLKINGNLLIQTSSFFSQTGGTITVDGNAGGVLANSVVSPNALVSIRSSNLMLNAGTLVLVDPHASSSSALQYNVSGSMYNAGIGHTFQFGDGISTDAGGSLDGFMIQPAQSTGRLAAGNLVVKGSASGLKRRVKNMSEFGILGNLEISGAAGDFCVGSSYVHVGGNLINNGILTVEGTLIFENYLSGAISAVTKYQIISGTGIFRNLSSSPTANFSGLAFNNKSDSGVTFLGTNWNSMSTTVSGTLTIRAGRINIGGAVFTLGSSVANPGGLVVIQGGFAPGSSFKRWIPVSYSDLYERLFPFVSPGLPSTVYSREVYMGHLTNLASPGFVTVKYNEVSGTVPINVSGGLYPINKRSNCNWVITTGGGLAVSSANDAFFHLAGYGIFPDNMLKSFWVTAANGLALGTLGWREQGQAELKNLSTAGLSQTLYPAMSGLTASTPSGGSWDNPSTWEGGVVPSCTQGALITKGSVVSINSAAVASMVSISDGGTLILQSDTFKIGCTYQNALFRCSGNFKMNGGVMLANGNIEVMDSADFRQNAGKIIIDGNDNSGIVGNFYSVRLNIPLFNAGAGKGTVTLSGGEMNIVDPHIGSTSYSQAYAFKSNAGANAIKVNVAPNYILRFGDGVSTAVGPNSVGFVLDNTANRLGTVIVDAGKDITRVVTQVVTSSIGGDVKVQSGVFNQSGQTTIICGNITVDDSATFIANGSLELGDLANTNPALPQTITVSGTGKVINAATSPTGNFTSLTFSNISASGVLLNELNNVSGVAGFKGVSVTGSLTFNKGAVTTVGTNVLLWGTSAAKGTGNIYAFGGYLSPGSTIALGYSATETGGATCTFHDSIGNDVTVVVQRTAPSGAGVIGVKYTNGRGVIPASIMDGSYSVSNLYKGKWDFVTIGTSPMASGFKLTIKALNAFGVQPLTANVRLTTLSGVLGTHVAGTVEPTGIRSGLTLAQLTAQSFYMGLDSAEVPNVTITSGDWSNPNIWSKGVVPSATQTVGIGSFHHVTISGPVPPINLLTVNNDGVLSMTGGTLSMAQSIANFGTVNISNGTFSMSGGFANYPDATLNISNTGIMNMAGSLHNGIEANGTYVSGGSLIIGGNVTNYEVFDVSGGTVTIGPAGGGNRLFNNVQSGKFKVSGGTFALNGNLLIQWQTFFDQSGGHIVIDGNAGGVIANSVPANTSIVSITGSSTYLSFSGGTFTIVDPKASPGSTGAVRTMVCNIANDVFASPNHTLRLGDGVSTDSSSCPDGMGLYFQGGGGIMFGNVIVDNKSTTKPIRFVSVLGQLGIQGNLTIQNGAELRILQGEPFIGGDFNNNGEFILSETMHLSNLAGRVEKPSERAQVISGLGSFRYYIHGASVASGGSGYVVGDILTLTGGTFAVPAQFIVTAVSSGAVTSVTGCGYPDYSVLPPFGMAATGGMGTGCTLRDYTNFARTVSPVFKNLSVNNSHASGVILNKPVSVINMLTMTSGLIHTTPTNLLSLGTSVTGGVLSAKGSMSNMIIGPFARTFASWRTITSAFDSTVLFPLGTSSGYNPVWVNSEVSSAGPVIITANAFDSVTGTITGSGYLLSEPKWELHTAGFSNLLNAKIKFSETNIGPASKIVKATTVSGVYDEIPGVNSVYGAQEPSITTGTSILAATLGADAYFAYTRPLAIWSGSAGSSWNNASNWCCGAVPTSETNVVIPTGVTNMPMVTDKQQAANITIQAGASLTLNTPASQLSVYGRIINAGTFTNSNGKLVMSGNKGPQSLPQGTYAKLEVNNPMGMVLEGDVVLTDSLILTSGKLRLDAFNFTLGNMSYAGDGFANSYIQTNGTGAVVLENIGASGKSAGVVIPVGNNSFNPVVLTNSGTTDQFTVRVVDSVTNQYSGNTSVGNKLTTSVVNRTWIINEGVAGGSNVTLKLGWSAADELSGFKRSQSFVSHYTATGWSGTTGSAAVGSNPFSQTRSGITSFSPFGVGSGTTLPVKLISFTGTKHKEAAQLNWVTASELNNDYFELQRSTDGFTFEKVTTVKGKGTTSAVSTYMYWDKDVTRFAQAAKSDKVYYRLVQVDVDGYEHTSGIIDVKINAGNGMMETVCAPNPFSEGTRLYVTSGKTSELYVRVSNLQGKPVLEKRLRIVEGSNFIDMDELSEVMPGMYYITLVSDDSTQTITVVKIK